MSPVKSEWKLVKGVPRADDFPVDVTHTVDPEYPHDMTLDDVLFSPALLFLVSPAVRNFLVERALKQVEFLPITILNHKKKPAAAYYILHPTGPVDCLDDVASGAKPDPIAPSKIHEIQRIVLRPEALDPERQMFRIERLYRHIIVKKSLAQAMDAAGFTGMSWTELSDFHKS
jgi:hypothetical protein